MIKKVRISELLKPQPTTPTKWANALTNSKILIPEQGITLYVILLLSLICTADIVVIGNWVETPGIFTIILISSLFPLFIHRIKLHPILIHLISFLIGTLLVLYNTLTLIKNLPLDEKLSELKLRLDYWYGIATTDGISTDLIPYTIFLLSLAWLLGYTSSWFTFRHSNIWISIVLNGVSILTCLSFLPEQYSSRFYLYAFTAMILITHITTVKQRNEWSKNGTSFIKLDGWLTLNSAIWYSIAILVISTAIPLKIYVSRPIADTWKTAREPVAMIENEFARLLGSVPSRTQQNGRFFGKFLPFIGSISFREEAVLTTKSDYPNYWVSRTYNTYTHEGWISGETHTIDLEKYSKFDNMAGLQSTKSVRQRIEMSFPSDQFFVGGNISSVSEPIALESLKPKTFEVEVGDQNIDDYLPSDLQQFELNVEKFLQEYPIDIRNNNFEKFLLSKLPHEYKYINTSSTNNGTDKISLTRSAPLNLDIVNWKLARQIPANKQLMMVSSVSVSSPEELRAAGQIYPGFIQDHYLELPEDMSRRIYDMTTQITAGKANPYDKAVAIEEHLRNGDYQYSHKVSTPPVGADGVEHFLFTSQIGYSDYFASAMTVMLRTAGIPARLVTGYSSGTYFPDKDSSIIKDSDSHGWVQVYFPSYGWIDFEPTPNWGKYSRLHREKTPSPFIRSASVYKDGDFPKLPDDFYDELGPRGKVSKNTTGNMYFILKKSILLPLSIIFSTVILSSILITFWRYGLSGLSQAEKATIKMYRIGALAGASKNKYQTIGEFSLKLSTRYPRIRTEIYTIAYALMKEKYSTQSPYSENLDTCWKTIRNYLWREIAGRFFKWAQKNENR
jgi:hypothetical protein